MHIRFFSGAAAGLLLALLLSFSWSALCRPSPAHNSYDGKGPLINPAKADRSYVLITPSGSKSNTIYLSDLAGNEVHQWKTTYQPYYAFLEKNSNLMVESVLPNNKENTPAGGGTGVIQELDWNGKVLWEYKNKMLTHDFDVLPNGNIAALIWEPVPDSISRSVRGGVPGTEFKGEMWSDAIIEVDRKGNIVWTWHEYEHLNPRTDAIGALFPRAEWTHSNSIKFIEKDPLTGAEAYLVSVREIGAAIIVRKNDGKLIWRSPSSIGLAGQHDATMLANGNVLVFDNGNFKIPNPKPSNRSRVVEIDPRTNAIVWEFDTGPMFKVDITGGAQRLANGNTLVVDGPRGHLFEISPDSKLIWDFINPFTVSAKTLWPKNSVFKARRYGNEIAWPASLPLAIPSEAGICLMVAD